MNTETRTIPRPILEYPVYIRDMFGMDALRVVGVNVIQSFDAALGRWVSVRCLTEDEREEIVKIAHMPHADRVRIHGYRCA
jgi:hypothetical protein